VVAFVQAWGIVFEASSSLLTKTGSEITSQTNTLLPYTQNEWFLNFVVLGAQLGFLILPAIVPIAFWIMRHKGLLERLAQK
ncbi:MAG: exosortase H-associated membrane protein, partial [Thiolinea sp.]